MHLRSRLLPSALGRRTVIYCKIGTRTLHPNISIHQSNFQISAAFVITLSRHYVLTTYIRPPHLSTFQFSIFQRFNISIFQYFNFQHFNFQHFNISIFQFSTASLMHSTIYRTSSSVTYGPAGRHIPILKISSSTPLVYATLASDV